MDSQAPPLHYPNSHDSTAEVYRTRQDELYSPTLVNGGYPLPAYGEEQDPPQYQETPEELAKAKKRGRNVLIVRVMTSIFIALIVSLIVAGAVTKIQQGKSNQRSEETDDAIDTMTDDSYATADLDTSGSTTQISASAAVQSVDASTTQTDFLTFECQCWSGGAAIPSSTSKASSCDDEQAAKPKNDEEFFLMGVSRYSSSDCRLARASFKGTNDDVRYQCTLSCRDPDIGEENVDEIMAGSWTPELEQ